MSFVKYGKNGYLAGCDGEPLYIVGVNYVASYICTNFWEDFRPEHIRADLEHIASMGLNAVRIPMHWYYMEPFPGQYNEKFTGRLRQFIDWCAEFQLYVMPWFLVGIATQSYDYPYRNGLSFFGPEMTELAENHLKHFIAPYCDEEWILFWDICDEPEFYDLCGKIPEEPPFDRRVTRRWARDCYRAIKEVDPNHLVTMGYGPIATDNFGTHIRDAVDIMDVLVVTAYPNAVNEPIDRMRSNYFIPYNLRFSALGKPVFCCEAPGHSNVFYSDEVLTRYFRLSFYSGLLAGSTGFMPWVYADFSDKLFHEVPLDINTAEPYFGICDANRVPKPRGLETAAFASFVKKAGITAYKLPESETAILVAPHYYGERRQECSRSGSLQEDVYETGDRAAFKKIYTCYILAQNAIGNIAFVWPDMDVNRFPLLIVPSTRGMTTSQWAKLRGYTENGGTLVVMYDDKSGLCAYTNELFGFTTKSPDTDYGYSSMTTSRKFASIEDKKTLPLTGLGGEVLRVIPNTCEVISRFDDGEPAMTVNNYGKGKAIFLCKNPDDGLLDVPYSDFLQKAGLELYRAFATYAGTVSPYPCADLRVETGVMHGEKDSILIAINHDTEKISSYIILPGNVDDITGFDGDPVAIDITGFDGDPAAVESRLLPICLEGGEVAVFKVK